MFNAKLIVKGYTHKFSVDVNGQEIIFEPDEEEIIELLLTMMIFITTRY